MILVSSVVKKTNYCPTLQSSRPKPEATAVVAKINFDVDSMTCVKSRLPNKVGGWICAAATYGTGEAEEGRESVALRHKLATLCVHCCLVQASR
ncbi:hypothetical protein J6590_011343 [Homalodisca vitripennis]|nr:hypothetical protein J6590_011340 [Homalodisca vitripennis]KAG8273798.1 hypothetical protein J6590_011343 [Homalodisca vitripennis]